MAVLPSGLPVVASLAQCPPVAPVPEQLPVTTVGNDMIHHRGFRVPAVLSALLTQRVRLEELFRRLAPCMVVSSAAGRSYVLRMLGPVLLTVLCSCWDKSRTAGMAARSIGFGGHSLSPSVLIRTQSQFTPSIKSRRRGCFDRILCKFFFFFSLLFSL